MFFLKAFVRAEEKNFFESEKSKYWFITNSEGDILYSEYLNKEDSKEEKKIEKQIKNLLKQQEETNVKSI